ncbi:MAG TPA: DUF3631 domain-containing protein [Candidatus Dormibacteraeota bacterium]|nr:DUF3631 domain-containing protein [Candidatus Dormibacteraeota bacterium]
MFGGLEPLHRYKPHFTEGFLSWSRYKAVTWSLQAVTNYKLLALADLAGGRWPELARAAAAGLTARAQEYSPIGSLLMDICLVFLLGNTERVFSREIVADLQAAPDRPWNELRKGRGVTEAWLAQQLRPYGIRPRTIRIGEEIAKGYLKEDFGETFRRYIPKAEIEATGADLNARVRKPDENGQQPEQGDSERED